MHPFLAALRPHRPLLLALLAGVLLGLPRALPALAPLQIPGFAAFFLLTRDCVRRREGVKFGALAGLVAAISALLLVRVHLAAALALLLSMSANYALFGLVLLWLGRRHPQNLWRAFAAGAGLVALGEWGFAHLFPVFGTAQYTTCPWSFWPALVRHEAILGSCATLLGAALLGAGLACLTRAAERRRALIGLGMTCALFAGLGWAGRTQWPIASYEHKNLRVAAVVGPAEISLAKAEKAYAPLIAQAAARNARVVVLPEMAVVDDGTAGTLHRFGALAVRHQITLVVGLLDEADGGSVNKAIAIGPDGRLLATHIKAHHIPFMEHYTQKGDGSPALALAPDAKLGLMICQDDNFTDLANATVAGGAQVLAVPTLDWAGVETAHFTNSRHRALETGVGLVRAAHGGIAAIFAPDGSVLAQRNHQREGDGVIVADVPLARPSPYVSLGDWGVLLLATGIAGWDGFWISASKLSPCAINANREERWDDLHAPCAAYAGGDGSLTLVLPDREDLKKAKFHAVHFGARDVEDATRIRETPTSDEVLRLGKPVPAAALQIPPTLALQLTNGRALVVTGKNQWINDFDPPSTPLTFPMSTRDKRVVPLHGRTREQWRDGLPGVAKTGCWLTPQAQPHHGEYTFFGSPDYLPQHWAAITRQDAQSTSILCFARDGGTHMRPTAGVLLVPVSLAADIVTSPIQLIAVVVGAASGQGKQPNDP